MKRIPEHLFKYCPKLPRQIYEKYINVLMQFWAIFKQIFENWLDEKNVLARIFRFRSVFRPGAPETPKNQGKSLKILENPRKK